MRKLTQKFVDWCGDNSKAAKVERTIAQGLIGVGVAALTGWAGAPDAVQTLVVPATMAVLSPIQAEIGRAGTIEAEGTD